MYVGISFHAYKNPPPPVEYSYIVSRCCA